MMKKSTFDRLSPRGKRRARVICVIDGMILTAIGAAAAIAAANAIGLVFIAMGWA